jgi:hypothetical protein
MMSKRLCGSFSYKRTSKFAVSLLMANRTACHSMLKMRFGAVPEMDVKMPHPFAQVEQPLKPVVVSKSCHKGKMVKSYGH